MILNSDYLKKIFKVINPENDKNLLKRILTNQQYVIFCLRYDHWRIFFSTMERTSEGVISMA